MIGRGVRIGCVLRCRRIDLRHCCGDQFLGARDIGLAAGAGATQVLDLATEREPTRRVGVGERRQEEPPKDRTPSP